MVYLYLQGTLDTSEVRSGYARLVCVWQLDRFKCTVTRRFICVPCATNPMNWLTPGALLSAPNSHIRKNSTYHDALRATCAARAPACAPGTASDHSNASWYTSTCLAGTRLFCSEIGPRRGYDAIGNVRIFVFVVSFARWSTLRVRDAISDS